MTDDTARHGPLRGVRVVDLGRLMPSSIATAELAALGAEVIKVELPPFGDYLRINPPAIGDRGDMHLAINRGKKSVCLDLRQAGGRAVLDRLIATSDVLVELSRPGAGEKIGFGRERVRELNPGIVHCSITGFGQTGPYAPLGAHGLSADAASGLLPLERDGERWVIHDGYVSVGPRASGMDAAIAILGALFEARASGVGTYLDVSQWDSAVKWNYRNLTLSANDVGLAPPYRELGPKYDIYETGDGRWVLLCAPEPKLWRAFCAAIDRHDLDGRTSDAVVDYDDDGELRTELRSEFARRGRDEWLALGIEHGFPIAPIVPNGELRDDPHVHARQMLVCERHPLAGDVLVPGIAVKGPVPVELAPAPELGEHTVSVVRSLGYDDATIDALLDDGILLAAS